MSNLFDYIVSDSAGDPAQIISVEKLRAMIREYAEEKKPVHPKAIVFEYTPAIDAKTGVFAHRKGFADGRHRIFLNPQWEATVEEWIASMTTKPCGCSEELDGDICDEHAAEAVSDLTH